MPDEVTAEERRLIDEYVASGRVYKARRGEVCDDVMTPRMREARTAARKSSKSIGGRVACAAGRRERDIRAAGGTLG
jgi:hypothetical protein